MIAHQVFNSLNAFLLAPQIPLLPTIVRVYKLYLLACLLAYLLTYLDGNDIISTHMDERTRPEVVAHSVEERRTSDTTGEFYTTDTQ